MSLSSDLTRERRTHGSISYLVQPGDPKARASLFLHGVFDSAQCWLGVLGALPEGGTRYALDARAHGHSPLVGTTFAIRSLAGDVIEFIDRVIGAPVNLIGHSMGGATAQIVAASRPDLIAHLVLVDPAWSAPATAVGPAAFPAQLRTLGETFRDNTPAEILEAGKNTQPGWDELDYQTWLQAKLDLDTGFMDLYQDWVTNIGPAHLARVTADTLLVTANPDNGSVVTEQMAADARTLLGTKGHRAHFPDAGHSLHKEDRVGFVEAITPFLT